MSVLSVVLYAAWTMALVGVIGLLRSFYTLSGRRAANSFQPFGADVSAFSNRLCRAHANCYENIGVFTAVVLSAVVTGHADVTDPLALVVVGARVAQSLVHIVSTHVVAVVVRLGFFAVQLVIIAVWVVTLVLRLM